MSKSVPHLQGLNCRDGVECSEVEAPLWRASFVAREVILVCPEGMAAEEYDIYFNSLIKYMVSSSSQISPCKPPTLPIERRDGSY